MKVQHFLIDGEFEPLQADLSTMGMMLNAVFKGEHIGDVKHYIHTIKEHAQCVYVTLPFQCMPAHLVIEMV